MTEQTRYQWVKARFDHLNSLRNRTANEEVELDALRMELQEVFGVIA